jgi:hypothetical protein
MPSKAIDHTLIMTSLNLVLNLTFNKLAFMAFIILSLFYKLLAIFQDLFLNTQAVSIKSLRVMAFYPIVDVMQLTKTC